MAGNSRSSSPAAKADSWPSDPADLPLLDYELVVIGSGNGACAFLAKYLEATAGQEARKVLVIEEGQDFLSTSAITHQANWTRSYSESTIFKLHNATTGPLAGRRPIISGRAVTQGGGGSINYTMMFESSDWLADQLGAGGTVFGQQYFDQLKRELGPKFHRRDPAPDRTPVAEAVHSALTNPKVLGQDAFKNVPGCEATGWIPQYIEGGPGGRVYTFTAQFNDWGERANSGVSLVENGDAWRRNSRVTLWTNVRVEELRFDSSEAARAGQVPCTGLALLHLGPFQHGQCYRLNPANTTVVMAAGSSTPRLLMPHRDTLRNPAIGKRVNDHILVPVGFYGLRQPSGTPEVSPRDQYLPLFVEQEVQVQLPDSNTTAKVVVGYDFFAGPVATLSYYLAHLFVSLWAPNWLKTISINRPWIFQQLKLATAYLIMGVNQVVSFWYGLLTGGQSVPPINVITGIVKFNITYEGYYDPKQNSNGAASTALVLPAFASDAEGNRTGDAAESPDGLVARQTLPALMRVMDAVGVRPWWWAQLLFKLLLRMPYNPESVAEIKAYVRRYADDHLLTQQHTSGGCILGDALEDGSAGPRTVGSLKGAANVVVADLSAVPLPRVSPQMTAYLYGYHVASTRYGGSSGNSSNSNSASA